jgi:hypothetical protein
MILRVAYLTLLASSAVALVAACSGRTTTDGCEPVTCELYCPGGFATGSDGCEICSCGPSACGGPSPAGCVVNGCPANDVCDTSQGCVSSSCSCDALTGSWACTDDCGGGICVPAAGACSGPDPSGCKSKGCPVGQVCNGDLGCFPSGCSCDALTGSWGCTADCGGGVCVADPTGCTDPDPTGCVNTGCPPDQVCQQASGVCISSSCTCDAGADVWVCDADCGGGICITP